MYLAFFRGVNMDGDNNVPEDMEPEQLLFGLVRGEIIYVPPPDENEDGGIDIEAEHDVVSSWMNPSGDGIELEIDPYDEGQTNNDDDECRQLQTNTDGEVYTY